MKTIFIALWAILLAAAAGADGIFKIRSGSGSYLTPVETRLLVAIDNQVATTVARQTFVNTRPESVTVKYCFPLNLNASVTCIAWERDSVRKIGKLQAGAQDSSTTGPGGTVDAALNSYLGKSPFYFQLPDTLAPGQEVVFEMTYIELLAYRGGSVSYLYPFATPAVFSSGTVELFSADVSLKSLRKVTALSASSWSGGQASFSDHAGTFTLSLPNPGTQPDFSLQYALDQSDLGLFMLSTQPDTGDGYFLMLAEPDPKTTQDKVINKVFTYVIDVSGSMTGFKIEQAKEAARFCVQNLNSEDRFNIVKFESSASPYQPAPIPASASNISLAVSYINALTAGGGTNINAALSTALSQYTSDTTSNVIIFITDGLASVNLPSIAAANTHQARIFVFGIGTDVDKSILTQIADQNNGVAEFLLNDQVSTRISSFYAKIKDPVIQKIALSFSAGGVDRSDLLPLNIPDIFVGEQLIVAGRYNAAGATQVTLSGDNTAGPVSYTYNTVFSDTSTNAFVAKIWAKMRIDALMSLIYQVGELSVQGQEYKKEVVSLSLTYAIQTKYTSFVDGGIDTTHYGTETESSAAAGPLPGLLSLSSFPNPMRSSAVIQFHLPDHGASSFVSLKVYDAAGRWVATLVYSRLAPGNHRIVWNGLGLHGSHLPPGIYFLELKAGDTTLRRAIGLLR